MVEKRTKDSVQVGESVRSSLVRDDAAYPADQIDDGGTLRLDAAVVVGVVSSRQTVEARPDSGFDRDFFVVFFESGLLRPLRRDQLAELRRLQAENIVG